jgi:hypothetical protein
MDTFGIQSSPGHMPVFLTRFEKWKGVKAQNPPVLPLSNGNNLNPPLGAGQGTLAVKSRQPGYAPGATALAKLAKKSSATFLAAPFTSR